jgi:hypothetical protein
VTRADAAGHVQLVAHEVRPLAVERGQERRLGGLQVHVRDAGDQVERPDGVPLALRRLPQAAAM